MTGQQGPHSGSAGARIRRSERPIGPVAGCRGSQDGACRRSTGSKPDSSKSIERDRYAAPPGRHDRQV